MELWLLQDEDANVQMRFRVLQVLHRERSAYQEIAVMDLGSMGRTLVLDDAIQVTERDAFVYHEMLVHVPLCAHPRPRRVLVVGGGDLGAVAEIVQHDDVERIDLVEIDARVVELSRTYLPWAERAARDPRLTIHYGDGFAFLQAEGPRYDVIIVDAPDPVGPGVVLFDAPFYEAVRRRLDAGGVMVTQSGSVWFQSELLTGVRRRLAERFGRAWVYWAGVPSYSIGPWTFTGVSLGSDLSRPDPVRAARLTTRYYSPEVHRAAFHLPPFLRERLDG